MKNKLALAAVTIALAVPAIAWAAGPDGKAKDRPSFPMSGEAFLEHVENRLDRMEERMEDRLADSDKSDADKEKVRARYEAMASKVMNAADEAAADGTVTKEEAKAMRKALRKGKKGKKGKRAKGDRPEFPMAGDAFVQHVEQRQAKIAERIEARLAKSDLDDERKAEIRQRFEHKSAQVLSAAKTAAADGTVTKEEAKRVRALAKKDRKGKRDKR